MRTVFVAWVLMGVGSLIQAGAQSMPENAKPSYLGNGWECERGFRQSGQECLRVQVPANAKLSYLGNSWECERGFRQSGQACLRVQVPANAKLSYLGNGWECERGFRQSGQECLRVQIPANAKLSYLGNSWECDSGFIEEFGTCRRMTPDELLAALEQKRQLDAYIAQRRARTAAGGGCQTEPDTNSQVCLKISDTDFDCDENYDGSHYDSCELEVEYDVTTDYQGSGSISASIECDVEIQYNKRGGYGSSRKSDDDSASMTLYSDGYTSGSFDFDFRFSASDEVISAKVKDVDCGFRYLGR